MDSQAKITWLGHSMFLIESREGTRVITDPYQAYTGYNPPIIPADIVTQSHHHRDHNNIEIVIGSPQIINTIGNYDIKDITIAGILSYHDEFNGQKRGENVIFKFGFDDISLAHMGDYGQLRLDEKQVNMLKGVDILLIPVGGKYTIDGVQAAEIVQELEPKVVIPMHYKTKVLTFDVSTAQPFLEEMPIVKNLGHTVELIASNLPKKTEVWVMEYSS